MWKLLDWLSLKNIQLKDVDTINDMKQYDKNSNVFPVLRFDDMISNAKNETKT